MLSDLASSTFTGWAISLVLSDRLFLCQWNETVQAGLEYNKGRFIWKLLSGRLTGPKEWVQGSGHGLEDSREGQEKERKAMSDDPWWNRLCALYSSWSGTTWTLGSGVGNHLLLLWSRGKKERKSSCQVESRQICRPWNDERRCTWGSRWGAEDSVDLGGKKRGLWNGKECLMYILANCFC